MGDLTVALCHLAPLKTGGRSNVEQLAAAFATGVAQGAELIVFPELATCGYGFADREAASKVAEPADGRTAGLLSRMCSESGVHAVAGFLELAPGGRVHNAAMVVGPDGVLGVQHKRVNPERRWTDDGHLPPRNYQLGKANIGVLICADSYYVSPAAHLVRQGAQLLVVIANWPQCGIDPRRIWAAHAVRLGVPVLAGNRTGIDGDFDARTGPSIALDAAGSILREIVSETPVVRTQRVCLAPSPTLPELDLADLGLAEPGAVSVRSSGPHQVSLLAGRPGTPGLRSEERWREIHLPYAQAANPGLTGYLSACGIDMLSIDAPALDERSLSALVHLSLDRIAIGITMPDEVVLAEPPEEMEGPRIQRGWQVTSTLRGRYTTITGAPWPKPPPWEQL